MEVKWLSKALQNLDAEAAYLAQDNPALGRPGRIPGTRELVVADTHYLVPYRVRSRLQQIEVLRVFHASRRLPAHW